MNTLKDKVVKCKKIHRCSWCNEKILVNELARYRVYIFEEFQTDYMHLECYDAMMNSDLSYFDDGWEEGMFDRGKLAEECDI